MPINCILQSQADKLKQAFRSGEISMSKLFSMSSAGRVELLTKYVGEGANMLVAKLEKAYMSPNQKLAMRNAIFKMFGEKPLYKGLSIEQADKISKGTTIKELKGMTTEQRINTLSKFVDENQAKILNNRFEFLSKTGNLKIWEEKAMGTETLRANAKLKGELSKLEVLDDLGVLNPAQVEDFMQTFVESKIGAIITLEESQKLSKLINKQRDIFDRLQESGDWTGANPKDNIDYRVAINELNKFTAKLQQEKSAVEFGNELVEISRNNILGTVFSGINSALYQVVPTIERLVTKRLTPATLRMDGTTLEKISAKISKGLFSDKEGRKFIKDQLKMALDIYDKTSMDISRTANLNDGYSFFGEKEKRGALPLSTFKKSFKEDIITPIKEAKGIRNKILAGASGYAEMTSNFPKWMAGGTDTIIANTTRAETAVLWSSEIAKLESIQNKLPAGMNEKERANQLLKDSYSPDTVDEKAQIIREQSILDAHYSNNTQPDGMADWAIKVRDAVGFGKFKFGKAIVPFLKITTATLSRGLQTAIPIGVIKELKNLNKAFQNIDEIEGIKRANKAIANLIGFLGLTATALLIASLLDDDDYIPPYAAMGRKEYKLAEARGARPSSIRIGGKWIPIRFLPMISIPISSIMMARQAKIKDESVIAGYIKGILTQILDTPIISEFYKLAEKSYRAVKKSDLDEMTEATGLDMQSIWDWAKIRMIPSMLSRDLYNAVLPTTKYNFLGEEVEKGRIFRDDKTNTIIIEFEKLDRKGEMPSISDPTGKHAQELEQKLGKEKYQELLAEYKRNYAEAILVLMNDEVKFGITIIWDDLSPGKKKKKINDLRFKEILKPIERKNKETESISLFNTREKEGFRFPDYSVYSGEVKPNGSKNIRADMNLVNNSSDTKKYKILMVLISPSGKRIIEPQTTENLKPNTKQHYGLEARFPKNPEKGKWNIEILINGDKVIDKKNSFEIK